VGSKQSKEAHAQLSSPERKKILGAANKMELGLKDAVNKCRGDGRVWNRPTTASRVMHKDAPETARWA
jgi:hypothetical protein